MAKLLIIDDKFEIISTLRVALRGEFEISTGGSVSDGLEKVKSNSFDIALLDLDLPDGSGLEILNYIKSISPSTDVVMMSGVATANDAFTAVKNGAYDFIDKPISEDKLKITLRNLMERRSLLQFVDERSTIKFVTQDEKVKTLLKECDKIAQSSLNILLTGDSGTGKEIFAEYIHSKSKRRINPFIKVNCAAITETLFESEFFGHKKGAFTGAVKDRKGKFKLADGGTLFLDEIGELPMTQQTKLLRVLEDQEFVRVGDETPMKVDVRVISATNRDLKAMIKDGTFREDLYYRINVVNFSLPKLRDRRDDIPLLANFFLKMVAKDESLPQKEFSAEANELLKELPFNGNIRELKNLVQKLFFISSGITIEKSDLQLTQRGEMRDGGLDSGVGSIFQETAPLNIMKKELEKQYIITQLKKHENNVSTTATALKILPNNLFRKMKDLGISVEK